MTGALDRLIARAWRPLSAVEPLFQPRYASAAAFAEPETVSAHPLAAAPQSGAGERQYLRSEPPKRPSQPEPVWTDPGTREVTAHAERQQAPPVREAIFLEAKSQPSPKPAASPESEPERVRSFEPLVIELPAPVERAEPAAAAHRTAAHHTTFVQERGVPVPQPQSPDLSPPPIEVHVSIGHIEVRTSPAPVTVANPRPAPPVGARLEEYLRRRTGERR